MWTHPATRANVARLRDDFGYRIVEPDAGPLASGQSGVGRLAELPTIVEAVVAAVGDAPGPGRRIRPPGRRSSRGPATPDLTGRHVVVSAGGTREAIDPVRFIGNRSTGRMGVAVADAALDRGARVTVVAANVEVAAAGRRDGRPRRVDRRPARRAPATDPRHRTARPASMPWSWPRPSPTSGRPTPADHKLERGAGLTLELEPTPDVLGQIARLVRGTDSTGEATAHGRSLRGPILVGFAAETGSLDRAADKLRRKGVDLLVANDVAEAGSGFGTDTNRVSILRRGRRRATTCRC